MIKMLAIELVECDIQLQPRAKFNDEWTEEYAQEMTEGAKFPPVMVFHDGERYWLADGFHRLRAALKAGHSEILADIRDGTRREALLHSLSANAEHGHRRTNEDKQRSVDVMLKDPEWVRWSDREIARQIGVSPEMVRLQRGPICQTLADSRVVSRSGTTYTMKISKRSRARIRSVWAPTEDNVSQADHVVQSTDVEPRHLIEENNSAIEEDNAARGDLVTPPRCGAGNLELPLNIQAPITACTKCYKVLYFDPHIR